MKKITAAILLVCALILCGCAKDEYSPSLVLDSGLRLSGDTIYGNFVNVYFLDPYSMIHTLDGAAVTVYKDSTYAEYLDGGTIELFDGQNVYYVLVGTSDRVKSYRLEVNCVMVSDIFVRVIYDKTYSINDDFDRASIEVTAKKDDGGMITVYDYSVDCDFSQSGVRRVAVEYGGITRFFDVTVE